MKRQVAAALSGIMLLTTLTGCSSKRAPEINSYELISRDDLLISQNIALDNEAAIGQITQQISGNIKVDTSALIAPTSSEQALIEEQISRIVAALHGKHNGSISDDLLNYLFWEFSRTQKEWEVSANGATILGIDPATRKIFVDIPFETTKNNKLEIRESKLIVGDPLESAYKSVRYEDYMQYMATKFSSSGSSGSIVSPWATATTPEEDASKEQRRQQEIEAAKTAFEDKWGPIDVVLEEQQERTLVDRLRNAIKTRDTSVSTIVTDDRFYTVIGEQPGGAQKTSELPNTALPYIQARGIGTYSYTGITKQTTFNGKAHMTFRFILDFDFNLGAATTITTTSAYLMEYFVEGYETPISGMRISDDVQSSLSVVSPYIDRLLNSYHKCIEESNYIGLYSLFGTNKARDDFTGDIITAISRFEDWDKYYVDWNRFAYIDFDAYTYEIVGWENTTLQVLATRSKKIRGKGTKMTMPTYEEKVLFTLQVESDDIFIESETALQTTLVGEPVSMLRDVTGIADKIAYNEQSFSVENEAAVLEALKNFSKVQLTFSATETLSNQGTGTPGSIDLGIGVEALDGIKKTMSNIKNVSDKIVWVGTWANKSNVYCKVRIREYFRSANSDIDTEAYVGLVNRDGVWTVVTYDRVVANAIGKVDITDKGCLTHDYVDRDSTSDYNLSASGSQSGAGNGDTQEGASNSGTPVSVPVQSEPPIQTSTPEQGDTSTDESSQPDEQGAEDTSTDESSIPEADTSTTAGESSSGTDTSSSPGINFDLSL